MQRGKLRSHACVLLSIESVWIAGKPAVLALETVEC